MIYECIPVRPNWVVGQEADDVGHIDVASGQFLDFIRDAIAGNKQASHRLVAGHEEGREHESGATCHLSDREHTHDTHSRVKSRRTSYDGKRNTHQRERAAHL